MGHTVRPGPADNAIYAVQDGHCIADEMASIGIRWNESDKRPGSRINGWDLMRQRLKGSVDRGDKGLFIFDTCRHFIRTIPVLPRDTDGGKPDDVDTHSEDHIADETRYRILAASHKTRSGAALGLA